MDPNWRDLSAGFDLDALIAEAQGWTDIYLGPCGQGGMCLYGIKVGLANGKSVQVPPFSTSAQSILPFEKDDVMEITVMAEGVRARMNGSQWEFGDTLAEARARAWLAMEEPEDGNPDIDERNSNSSNPEER